MSELISGGVDIPNKLREELADGKVIFFCGAGVSAPAGLPMFSGLVDQVWNEIGLPREGLALNAYKSGQYDKVFDLWERHGERNIEPQELRRIVKDKLATPENPNLTPHKTLIKLSHSDDGIGRLITTNFDELFQCAYQELYPDASLLPDCAPRLPVPKPDTWHSIVHLHGSVFDVRDPSYANIVLSSADFGRAYLVERWASRFVTELFRNFRVIFIGYQVEDPVMRYLVDALAAAREKGEGFQEPYAFVAHGKSNGYLPEQETKELWKTKGINALTYHYGRNHHKLWASLDAWAALHTGGFDSKRSLALRHASNPPVDPNDPEIQNVCWALKQADGNIAKAFANHEPVPSIRWLTILDQNGLLDFTVDQSSSSMVRYTYEDLHEPTPVAFALSQWLVRHLDKIELLEWFIEKGGVPCHRLRWILRGALDENNDLPGGMKKIWEMLASEDYASKKAMHCNHIAIQLREPTLNAPHSIQAFLNSLKPVPNFKKNIMRDFRERRAAEAGEDTTVDEAERQRATTYAEVDIDLVGSDYASELKRVIENVAERDEILASIAHQLTDILLEIMDLYNHLSLANETSDLSYVHQPSISDHEQNREHNNWTLVIELLRMSFDAIDQRPTAEAEALMRRWQRYNYPVFRRLVLYAAAGARDE